MNKLKVEDIAAMIKANDFLKKEEEEKKFPRAILWALAIIGAIAAVAGIAYAVYLYFTPDYLEDFEDDFDGIPFCSEVTKSSDSEAGI